MHYLNGIYNFLSDLEIYVDNLAGMQIRNMNTMIEQTRMRLQNNGIPDSDHYMKTLEAASINEDNYFNNLLGNDIAKIAKDLRDAHGKDADTGEQITPVEDMLGAFVFILLKMYRRSGGTETAVPADGNRQSGAGNRRHHAG